MDRLQERARSSFSGRIEGGPIFECRPSEFGESTPRASSTIARIGHSGCPAGTRVLQLTQENMRSVLTLRPRVGLSSAPKARKRQSPLGKS